MVRKPRFDENGIKKGAWSQEEDDKLRAYVLKYGHWNWRQLPKFAGLSRCGKSCRLRWLNYLRRDVKRGNYTKEEDDLILKMIQEHGNKWSLIATKLSGRTDNEIKNYWHSCLKKRPTIIERSNNIEIKQDNSDAGISSHETIEYKVNREKISTQENDFSNDSSQGTSESYSQLTESSSTELSSNLDSAISNDIILFPEENTITSFESIGNFWNEPFLLDHELHNLDFSLASSSKRGVISPYDSYYDDNIEFFDQQFIQEMLENL